MKAPRRLLFELRRYDRRLTLEWDPKQGNPDLGPLGRWVLKEYVPAWGNSAYITTWQGPDGEHRDLPTSAEPLIVLLGKADMTRFGTKAERTAWWSSGVDARRMEAYQRTRDEMRARAREEGGDWLARAIGQRRSVPASGPVSRNGRRWDRSP